MLSKIRAGETEFREQVRDETEFRHEEARWGGAKVRAHFRAHGDCYENSRQTII